MFKRDNIETFLLRMKRTFLLSKHGASVCLTFLKFSALNFYNFQIWVSCHTVFVVLRLLQSCFTCFKAELGFKRGGSDSGTDVAHRENEDG